MDYFGDHGNPGCSALQILLLVIVLLASQSLLRLAFQRAGWVQYAKWLSWTTDAEATAKLADSRQAHHMPPSIGTPTRVEFACLCRSHMRTLVCVFTVLAFICIFLYRRQNPLGQYVVACVIALSIGGHALASGGWSTKVSEVIFGAMMGLEVLLTLTSVQYEFCLRAEVARIVCRLLLSMNPLSFKVIGLWNVLDSTVMLCVLKFFDVGALSFADAAQVEVMILTTCVAVAYTMHNRKSLEEASRASLLDAHQECDALKAVLTAMCDSLAVTDESFKMQQADPKLQKMLDTISWSSRSGKSSRSRNNMDFLSVFASAEDGQRFKTWVGDCSSKLSERAHKRCNNLPAQEDFDLEAVVCPTKGASDNSSPGDADCINSRVSNPSICRLHHSCINDGSSAGRPVDIFHTQYQTMEGPIRHILCIRDSLADDPALARMSLAQDDGGSGAAIDADLDEDWWRLAASFVEISATFDAESLDIVSASPAFKLLCAESDPDSDTVLGIAGRLAEERQFCMWLQSATQELVYHYETHRDGDSFAASGAKAVVYGTLRAPRHASLSGVVPTRADGTQEDLVDIDVCCELTPALQMSMDDTVMDDTTPFLAQLAIYKSD
mmetsp:Transcript_58796/g.140152  ORF Transcript_58796/g.140152 Transcript_58796/m.140152 type:complete len:610 (+) Transcript_58796:121-1950(+)